MLVSSANAWSAESFTGWDWGSEDEAEAFDTPYPYMTEDYGVSVQEDSGVTKVTTFNASWDFLAFRNYSYYTEAVYPLQPVFVQNAQTQRVTGSGTWVMGHGTASRPSDFPVSPITVSFPSLSGVGNNLSYGPNSFGAISLTLSFSVPATSTAISLGLNFPNFSFALRRPESGSYAVPSSVGLYVNDHLIREYKPTSYDLLHEQDIYYADSRAISSVKLVFEWADGGSGFPFKSALTGETVSGATSYGAAWYILSSSYVSYSLLDSSDVLDAWNDEAQDSLNQQNSYEAQWTAAMESNFDALNFSGFSWNGDLLSAAALISGIFSDIWNLLGDYQVVVTFPIYFGISFLALGRRRRDDVDGE